MCNEIPINIIYTSKIIESLKENKSVFIVYDDSITLKLNQLLPNISYLLHQKKDQLKVGNEPNENLLKSYKKISVLIKDIKVKYDYFINTINHYILQDNSGRSIVDLFELQLSSSLGFNLNDDLYKEFIKDEFLSYSDYSWAVNYIDNILDTKIINDFIIYRRFKDIKNFKVFKENIRKDTMIEVYKKLSCLLNNKYSLSPPIYNNEFTDSFLSSNIPLDIDDDTLRSYVSHVKDDFIKSALNEIKRIKWYHYFNLKKRHSMKKNNYIISEKCKEIESKIFNQFKENIDSLNLYLNSFSFLSDILKDEYFSKIKDYIYEESEMYTFLNNIKENLLLYGEYNERCSSIKNLSKKQWDVLNFCYANSKNIDEFKSNLIAIPKLILFSHTNKIKEDRSIIPLEYIDELVKDLGNDLQLLYEIINDSIILKSNKLTLINSNIKLEQDIDDSSVIFNVNRVDDDSYLKLIDNYLGEYRTTDTNSREAKTNNIKRMIVRLIKNFGFETKENFITKNNITLELIAYRKDDKDIYVYILSDAYIYSADDALNKLMYLSKNKIPTIFCWSKLLLEDNKEAILTLKNSIDSILIK